jgi:hypothetical protein
MNGAQRVSVLLNFLGGQHEVRLRSDAAEPVDGEDSKDDSSLRPVVARKKSQKETHHQVA